MGLDKEGGGGGGLWAKMGCLGNDDGVLGKDWGGLGK